MGWRFIWSQDEDDPTDVGGFLIAVDGPPAGFMAPSLFAQLRKCTMQDLVDEWNEKNPDKKLKIIS